MLKIRLKRVGRKNDPSYRVVVLPSTEKPQSGKELEILGNYDARRKVKELKSERIKHWITMGAQLSDTVHNLLVSEKIIEGKKRNALPKKTSQKGSEQSAVSGGEIVAEAVAEAVAETASSATEEAIVTEEAPAEVVVEETQATETEVATEAPATEEPKSE